MHLGHQAQTSHTPKASLTYRVQLLPDVLDPLRHGLGHAIFRLALVMLETDALAQPVTSAAGAQASTAQQPGASRILETTLSTVAGELPLLHSRLSSQDSRSIVTTEACKNITAD